MLILECGDDLARILIPASVWPPEKRELLAVDRPVALTGESDLNPFRRGPWLRRYGSWTAIIKRAGLTGFSVPRTSHGARLAMDPPGIVDETHFVRRHHVDRPHGTQSIDNPDRAKPFRRAIRRDLVDRRAERDGTVHGV